MAYGRFPVMKADGYRAKRENVAQHLAEICRDYFKGKDGKAFQLAPFHVELLERMFEGGKYVVNWPTDHMKSDLTTFLFPLLSLIEDPDESHIICGATLSEAKSRVGRLTMEITTNQALTRDFPWIKKPTQKDNRVWTSTQFTVQGRTISNNNPSVRAVGWTSDEVRQSRGKLIMDDLEGAKVRSSPTERQRLYDFITLEAWRCWEDSGETTRPLLMSVGTPFDPDSIYFQLELIGWQVRRFSAYIREYDESGKWSPQYEWPRKAPKIEEARREMPKERFNIQYRLDPTGGDPTKLSAQQIVEMMRNGSFEEDQVRTYISLDPASGSRHRLADYAGIAVVRISWKRGEELPTVDVTECYAFRLGLFEQVRLCQKLHQEYGCPVIYEANSQQGYNYPDTFKHVAPSVPLLRHYTTEGAKFDEKTGLTVFPMLLKAGRLRVPQSQLESDGVVALTKEIRDLNLSGAHDHILASIWFAYKRTFDEIKQWAAPVVVNQLSRAYFTPYTRFANLRQPRIARR